MNIFLSHSVAPEDGPVASRLKAVAAAYGIRVLLPERVGASPKRTLSPEALGQIRAADAVVALITERATQSDWVLAELLAAEAEGKPIVALVEDDVTLDGNAKVSVHTVRFDRENAAAHELKLVEVLSEISAEVEKKKKAAKAKREATAQAQTAAVGAFARIAIALLALGAIAVALSEDEEEEETPKPKAKKKSA